MQATEEIVDEHAHVSQRLWIYLNQLIDAYFYLFIYLYECAHSVTWLSKKLPRLTRHLEQSISNPIPISH